MSIEDFRLKIEELEQGELVDYTAALKSEYEKATAMLKDIGVEQIPKDKKSVNIEGEKHQANVAVKSTLKITEVGYANFWKTVGANRAKNLIKRVMKPKYSMVSSDAMKQFLKTPQGDPVMAKGKKFLKANSNIETTTALKITKIKKDD